MRVLNYFLMFTLVFSVISCSEDTIGVEDSKDVVNDDGSITTVNPDGSTTITYPDGTKVNYPLLFDVSFGASESTTDEEADAASSSSVSTRISLNPTTGASFYWSTDEHITAIDMTDNYYGQTQTDGSVNTTDKSYDMYASASADANIVAFDSSLPIFGLTKEDGSLGEVNVYAYAPSDSVTNTRYPGMIQQSHRTYGNVAQYNDDYVLFNFPTNRYFDIDVTESIYDTYNRYGRYLPFLSLPITQTYVVWNAEDEVAEFSDPPVFYFWPIFHTITLRIYPDLDNPDVTGILAHTFTATVTMLDNTSFETSLKLNMNNFKYHSYGLQYMLEQSEIDFEDGEETYETKSISATINYFDSSGNKLQISPTSRVGSDGLAYMAMPLITPCTNGTVQKFEVSIEFYDLDGDVVASIYKTFNDTSLTKSQWAYGEWTTINLREEDFSFPSDTE